MSKWREEWEDCCGHCRFHTKDGPDWVCENEESEYYGCETEYGDCCDAYENRRREGDKIEWARRMS